MAEVVVHALWSLEGPQLLFSLLLCGEALQLFAELRMEKALALKIIAFLTAILYEAISYLRLRKDFALPVNCRLMFELRPHKMC